MQNIYPFIYAPHVSSEYASGVMFVLTDGVLRIYTEPKSIRDYKLFGVTAWQDDRFVRMVKHAQAVESAELLYRMLLSRPATRTSADKSEYSYGCQLWLSQKNTHVQHVIERLMKPFDMQNLTDEHYHEIAACLESMVEVYNDGKRVLIQRSLQSRYDEVEVPVSMLLNNRLLDEGIKYDQSRVLEHLNDAVKQKERIASEMLLRHDVDPTRLSYDYEYALDKIGKKRNVDESLRAYLERNRSASLTADMYKKYIQSVQAEGILSKMTTMSGYFKPYYDTFGTVTGRIITRAPYIQGLPRKYRDVILPGENKKLIYVDYKCYELAIYAILADDTYVAKGIETGDFYSFVASILGVDNLHRDEVKKAVIAFLYGMSSRVVEEQLAELRSPSTDHMSIKMVLPALARYRARSHRYLLKHSYVQASCGYRRYRAMDAKSLESWERRWSVNHMIQSTGSAILKDYLMKTRSVTTAQVLVPVHDAVLFEVEMDTSTNVVEELCRLFLASFETVLGRALGKAEVKNWSGD